MPNQEQNSSSSGNDSNGTPNRSGPKNVPHHLWQKFKALEKRTNETTQRSTEKRIKHLQKNVLKIVTKELSSEEDRNILKEHDVKLEPSMDRTNDRKRKLTTSETNPKSVNSEKDEILSLMSVNDHLQRTDHSRPPPETFLEKQLSKAVKEGNFSKAEALSDKLATFEAGERVAAAFDAKKFLAQKEEEKETTKAKKKRKLHWGFEPKQRWETKGNM